MVPQDWKAGLSHGGAHCVLNAQQEGDPPSLFRILPPAQDHHVSEKDKSSWGDSGGHASHFSAPVLVCYTRKQVLGSGRSPAAASRPPG